MPGGAPADPSRRTDGGVPAPSLEAHLGDEWERIEDRVETLFQLSAATVRGHTLVYEDAALRRAVAEASGGEIDETWRFVFATRLQFRPPLPPGVGTAMILPTVRSEAEGAFVADLRERGFESIERGRSERIRTSGGARARLRTVSATFDPPGVATELPIEGWVGVWADADVHVAGGAYPATPLSEALDLSGDRFERAPGEYRDELLRIVRAVG